MEMRARMSFEAAMLSMLAALFCVVAAATLAVCQGHLIYSLDDPYIHLALAEKLVHLHYGINEGEYSAPASSVLYPFILALFLRLGLGAMAPLLINMAASAGTILVTGAALRRLGIKLQSLPPAAILMIAGTAVLCANLVGLAMTGMEHSLHVLLTACTVLGLLHALQTGTVRWWLLACIAAQPLIRFEGLAVAGAAALVLLLARHARSACAAAVVVGAEMGVSVGATRHMGLPAMPSSVLVKSPIMRAADAGSALGFARTMVMNAYYNEMGRPALLLSAMLACLILWLTARPERLLALRQPGQAAAQAGLALFAAIALAAHLAAGQCGWFERYEAYALFIGAAGIAATWRSWMPAPPPRPAPLLRSGIFCGLACMILLPYARATLLTPLAAADIYRQQYQMHRFATAFHHGPVGVNDIGLVSFDNPSYVLDFWGLASEPARLARQRDAGVGWMASMAAAKNVGAVMIYDRLFPAHPDGWVKIGVLNLDLTDISPASPQVTFYATDAAQAEIVRRQFAAFSATLPPGASATLTAQAVPAPREPRLD